MKDKVALAIATAGGAGYVPKGPGTAGALLGLAAVAAGLPPLPATAVFLLPAVWASSVTANLRGTKDPQIVVIDEVLGQWVTLAGASLTFPSLLAAFVLFRFFDIVKPWPIRRVEAVPGGWGIVLDDLLAGVYGFLAMHLLRWGNLIT